MKSIFDSPLRAELVKRISSLTDQNKAQWGKMNVFQMAKHCTLHEDMVLGKLAINRVFIGRLIGPMILKQVLKDDRPVAKNTPTSALLKTVGQSGDLERQKKEWLNQLEQVSHYNHPGFVHPFFGPMTRDQVGFFVYKHTDHHLRQFGV